MPSDTVRPRAPAAASLVLVGLSIAGLTGCSGDSGAYAGSTRDRAVIAAAAATITEEDLRARVSVLAHDSMLGRATPSPELDATARWIAQELSSWGLEPAFGDGYVQNYPIRVVSPDPEATWAAATDGKDTLRMGPDVTLPFGPPDAAQVIEAPVVVVRGGRGAMPSQEEVSGKHVIVAFDGREARERESLQWLANVRALGPAAVWWVNYADDRSWRTNSELQSAQARTVVGESNETPVVSVRSQALFRMFEDNQVLAAALESEGATTLPGVHMALSLGLQTIAEDHAPNAAALLRGSDPELSHEFVVYSAHMDHVGVGAPDASGDSIYNGADDDASGTSTVLEVAQAFAALDPAPRRSMIFLLVSGEERGLWGSRVFAENPPVPIEMIVANLNADMVGRNWSDTIVVIGKEHSDLGRILEDVNTAHPELGMTAIDDLWPDENFYGRSDHFNFARRGVPVLFFFNGTHADYHRPSDEVDRIDAEKAARIGKLMFYLGLEVADRDSRPEWNERSRARIVEGR